MKFREHITKAMEIQNGTAAWYRERSESVNQELSKIRNDKHLSPEGKQAKMNEFKGAKAMEIIEAAHDLRKEYLLNLQVAKGHANHTIKSAVKRPNDDVVAEFEKVIKRLKTEVMLSTRYESAKAKIDEVIEKVNDPYLAEMLADEFAVIIPNVLASAKEPAKAKLELSAYYNKLSNDFLPEEAKAAKEALRYIEAAEANPKLFPLVVENNADAMFGGAGKYLNDPDAYQKLKDGNELS
jgi:hypothetical protein